MTSLPSPPNFRAHMNVADASNTLLDARDIQRALQRMASEIVAFAGGTDRLVLVGIHRRGVDLARRLDKPVVIHCRDAHEDTARIEREYPGVRGVRHCDTRPGEQSQW